MSLSPQVNMRPFVTTQGYWARDVLLTVQDET
jgi:hypothetical protein